MRKFRILLFTCLFLMCFGVFAYADDEIILPDDVSKAKYYVIFNCKKGTFGNYKYMFISSNDLIKCDDINFYSLTSWKYGSIDGKTWNFCYGGSSTTYHADSYQGTLIASNFDVPQPSGGTFFIKPQVPYWSIANLGKILAEVRPIARIVVGFLVLIIAFRKGWTLLRNSLKGL